MKGVTLATFRAYIKPGGTKAELRAITDQQLSTCYRRQYWDAVLGAELPDGIDYAVFDFAVNSGPGRAAKYLQAVVGVPQDGRIGPATIAAVKAKPAGVVIDALCDARLAFLKRLSTWGAFGKGWSSRVASVRTTAKSIACAAPAAAPPARIQPVPAPNDQKPPQAAPVPPVRETQPLPAPTVSKPVAAAGIFAVVSIAAASFWHHIVQFVSNLF